MKNSRDGLLEIDAKVPVLVSDPGGITTGQRVSLAIRPEKISLSRFKGDAANNIPITVVDMAFTGVASNYRVSGPNGIMLKTTQPNQRSKEAPMEWEEQGYACFDPADVVVLQG